MQGLAGNDTLFGSAGADTLEGGDRTDTGDYAASDSAVTVNLQAGSGAGGTAAGDVLISIEDLVGSGFGDLLTGNAGANLLNGGDGADVLIGGLGNDSLFGGIGVDTADYSAALLAVTVNLTTGLASGGAGNDTLTGVENVIGTTSGDVLTGDAADNLLVGGARADTMAGGTGVDTVDYAASAIGVIVNLANGNGKNGDAAGDMLSGIENVTGSLLNDSLTGDDAGNLLVGLAGNELWSRALAMIRCSAASTRIR